jgi:hypothetical protein
MIATALIDEFPQYLISATLLFLFFRQGAEIFERPIRSGILLEGALLVTMWLFNVHTESSFIGAAVLNLHLPAIILIESGGANALMIPVVMSLFWSLAFAFLRLVCSSPRKQMAPNP